ncbi:hypothetical protein HK099_008687 [Clydaea vesicula]|uniref:Uncharacterized protein n=1 Tax=Clydaea vesicula TaxID=447962 RepID=A0AAD5XT12_9FUNG|nr:hypothetical protein HK099_008687 [Clydaea vesicula]KAJ3380558.1 hypothetical protein HDU92_005893 [Lobulomyces angularis]
MAFKSATVFPTLRKLEQDLVDVKKTGNVPSINDIEEMAERTWKANFIYENEIAKLQREKENLEMVMHHIWKNFDEVVLSIWKVDKDMITVYESLVNIKKELVTLSEAEPKPSNAKTLRNLQERLHQIENCHCINGIFVPAGWKHMDAIPKGQNIIATLLARNYKLIRKLLEKEPAVSENLVSLENRLKTIIHKLKIIKESYDAKYDLDVFNSKPIEIQEIRFLQEDLQAIDTLKKNGVFLDEEGNIPEGQAKLRDLEEEAYDLVHECLVEFENDGSTILSDLIATAVSQARYVSDSIVGSFQRNIGELPSATTSVTDSPRMVALPTVYNLKDKLVGGIEQIKAGIQHQREEKPIMNLLASTTRSALGYVNKNLFFGEPVDETFKPIYDSLIEIRRELKDLRNEKDHITLNDNDGLKTEEQENEFIAKLNFCRTKLSKIEATRMEDGKFKNEENAVPSRGQATLSGLIDECYILVAEVL